MTVKEKIICNLVGMGLPENQAIEIVNAYLPTLTERMAKECSGYTFCWDCPADYPDYGMYFYGLWNEMLAPIVLKWIDENNPQAWFRPNFEAYLSDNPFQIIYNNDNRNSQNQP